VWISPDAAGYGWFTDTTAASDALFDAVGQARQGTKAAGHMDLQTVLLHEMGHLLGNADLDSQTDATDLMAGTLHAGERRISALDAVFGSL
jgi:hypothetical protein